MPFAAHHGLVRAFIVSSEHRAGNLHARQLLQRINLDAGKGARTAKITTSDCDADAESDGSLPPIVVEASAEGLPPANISIPLTANVDMLPLAVASEVAAAAALRVAG